MTAFCLSSTSRSHPHAFTVFAVNLRSRAEPCAAAGVEKIDSIPEPLPTGVLVDTPEDEPADQLPQNDPSSSPRPDDKHGSEQEHRRF